MIWDSLCESGEQQSLDTHMLGEMEEALSFVQFTLLQCLSGLKTLKHYRKSGSSLGRRCSSCLRQTGWLGGGGGGEGFVAEVFFAESDGQS